MAVSDRPFEYLVAIVDEMEEYLPLWAPVNGERQEIPGVVWWSWSNDWLQAMTDRLPELVAIAGTGELSSSQMATLRDVLERIWSQGDRLRALRLTLPDVPRDALKAAA